MPRALQRGGGYGKAGFAVSSFLAMPDGGTHQRNLRGVSGPLVVAQALAPDAAGLGAFRVRVRDPVSRIVGIIDQLDGRNLERGFLLDEDEAEAAALAGRSLPNLEVVSSLNVVAVGGSAAGRC